jgi:MbtH protein
MEEVTYVVDRNHEGQYSIWYSEREVPAGWEVRARPASKEACLQYINDAGPTWRRSTSGRRQTAAR